MSNLILLPSAAEEDVVFEVLEDWERASTPPVLRLHIGNEDFSEHIVSGEWGQSEGPAISMSMQLAGVVPRRLQNAPVSLSVDVAGVEIPQMQGYLSRPEPAENRTSTNQLAASLGALLSKVKLNISPNARGVRLLEYPLTAPHRIIWDLITRLPYDLSRVSVDPISNPLLSFIGSEGGLKPEQHPSDGLAKVLESVGYTLSDTAFGGHRASLEAGIGHGSEVLMTFDADDIKWKPPTLLDEQYTAVEVFRLNPDGSDAYRWRENVYYPNLDYPPIPGQILLVPFADETADGPRNARQYARDLAAQLAWGNYKTEMSIPFMPLVARGSVFRVVENTEDYDGRWTRSWLCVVNSYKHPFGTDLIDTTLSASATMEDEVKHRSPRIELFGVSAGVLATPPPVYGVQGSDIYFTDLVDWVAIQGDDLIFYDSAPEFVSVEGDDIVVWI